MKKYIFLLLMVGLSLTVFAQTNAGENDKKKKKTDNFLFAVLGGQLTTINGPESYDSPLFGFVAGFGIRLADFGNNWSINTSLEYSQQGSKYSDYVSGKVVLSYLNLPIIGRYQAKSGFYGEAGLQPGLLLSAKDKYEGGNYDFKDQVNSFDLGIPFGIGYHFKNGFDAGLRVVPGLMNLEKEGTDKSHNFVMAALRASYYF